MRLNKKFRQFKKGYLPGWTEEVFVVQRIIPGVVPTYKIEEFDGTLLKGTFYERDLQKVNVSKDDLFRVDKVVKRRGNKVLIRWKGWPDKYDSWIDKNDVKNTLRMNDEFYITLPTHSNRAEFPHNQSNPFKIRLPHPIRLQGLSWKVG